MKKLGIIGALLFLLSLPTSLVQAQSWVVVAPAGEKFSVQMPEDPIVTPQRYRVGHFDVEGRVYSAAHKGVTYFLWSLTNPRFATYKTTEGESYEDACADLAWEGLLKPWWSKLPAVQADLASLTWVKSLKWLKISGTDYFLRIGDTRGLVHIVTDREQVYVLAITNPGPSTTGDEVEHFLNTFSLGSPLPWPYPENANSAAEGSAPPPLPRVPPAPAKPEANGATDYNRVFSGKEVTERARVLSKPEPSYTERARRYSVTGTVVLRAVFNRSGDVTNVQVVSSLPHGLTQQTVLAALKIKFTPATKDGQPVSTYIQLEYNFRLY